MFESAPGPSLTSWGRKPAPSSQTVITHSSSSSTARISTVPLPLASSMPCLTAFSTSGWR